MFELLLQADRALADGLFDQAERTYWQLIELDPTNAIAVAGMARVSLHRGDERLARTFADRALAMDPDNIAARRVIEALERTSPAPTGPQPPDLTLKAAERLEALSRRRGAEGGATAPRGSRSGAASAAARSRFAADDEAETAGPGSVPGSRPGAAPSSTTGPGTLASKEGRGRTRPDETQPLPKEPLRERRQAGRLAAAAAAAAAAAREPAHPRKGQHHAMPVGRRFFAEGDLKLRGGDAFSEAEMAAAVAAVDAVDELGVAIPETVVRPPAASLPRAEPGPTVGARNPDVAAAEPALAAEEGPPADTAADETSAGAPAAEERAAGGSTEDEAEAEALREALEIVLSGERDQLATDLASHGRAADATGAAVGGPVAEPGPAEEPTGPATGTPGGGLATGTPESDRPAKRGFFHRIRGS
jgi:tetratricopeptide (TPR) repeat protein